MLHGYCPPERFLSYLTWTQIADLPDKANTVIVLPAGSTEQHGPHLPCAVDSVISAGVLGKALEKLPALVRAFGLAPITYGKSDEHLHFPGTMTLTGPTLLAVVTENGESVYRAGFRKLLLANGANVESADKDGIRPIDRAIGHNNEAAVVQMLKKGAKLGPTTWAMAKGKPRIA